MSKVTENFSTATPLPSRRPPPKQATRRLVQSFVGWSTAGVRTHRWFVRRSYRSRRRSRQARHRRGPTRPRRIHGAGFRRLATTTRVGQRWLAGLLNTLPPLPPGPPSPPATTTTTTTTTTTIGYVPPSWDWVEMNNGNYMCGSVSHSNVVPTIHASRLGLGCEGWLALPQCW